MKVIMGSVVKGYKLKTAVREHLESLGHEVIDVGCYETDKFVKFPAIGERVAKALQDGVADFAINCCGSGTGAGIVTNKYRGVCAVSCESVQTARLSRIVNDANCLCMGESVVPPDRGCEMAEIFLKTGFQQISGIPQDILDFWKEARDEVFSKGEIANEREIEIL